MTYEAELRDCLELILGTRPPEPEPGSDPLLVTRQWLAERNLGLVGVADPAGFDWPGHWIARVRTGGEDHAVVMFGSPSGPLHDPMGALAGDGIIVEGCLLARLDVHLPIDEPYGNARSTGIVAAILIAAAAEAALVRVESANAVAGRGLEGDRYHDGRGTFSGPGRGYQLTLVEAEVLDELKLPWEEARPQHRHPRDRPQRPGRPPLHGRRGRVHRPPAGRAMRTSRAGVAARPAAPARASCRAAG